MILYNDMLTYRSSTHVFIALVHLNKKYHWFRVMHQRLISSLQPFSSIVGWVVIYIFEDFALATLFLGILLSYSEFRSIFRMGPLRYKIHNLKKRRSVTDVENISIK